MIKYDIIYYEFISNYINNCSKGDRNMSFRDTLAKKYAESYLDRYGDRLTQVQGHVLSVKISTRTILWIYNILTVDILVKPERSKAVTRCQFKKKRWFKKPTFMNLRQGNLVVIQGLKGKKGKDNSDVISVLNVRNLTTKEDLVPVDQKVQKVQQRQFIK